MTDWFLPLFGVLWLAGLAVWIFALVDCIRVPDDSMFQNGTKLIWVIVIVLASIVGAIIYLVIGRPKAGARPMHRSVPPPPPPPPL
jgi:Phospholipase_D-nuclease N-terminal